MQQTPAFFYCIVREGATQMEQVKVQKERCIKPAHNNSRSRLCCCCSCCCKRRSGEWAEESQRFSRVPALCGS